MNVGRFAKGAAGSTISHLSDPSCGTPAVLDSDKYSRRPPEGTDKGSAAPRKANTEKKVKSMKLPCTCRETSSCRAFSFNHSALCKVSSCATELPQPCRRGTPAPGLPRAVCVLFACSHFPPRLMRLGGVADVLVAGRTGLRTVHTHAPHHEG